MAASVTLVLTSLVYCLVAAYFCLRVKGLGPSSTKAPYALLLALGIILQLVTYVLIVLNFAFRAFLSRTRQIPLLAIISASFFRLLPLLLLVCVVRALHARLSALKAARPASQQGRFKPVEYFDWIQIFILAIIWVFLSLEDRTVSDAFNGRRQEANPRSPPLFNQLGELLHAVVFMSLTYMMLVFSRRMNGFLLLPDQVLLALSTRVTPLFLFRSSYMLIDAILPFIDPRIRILTPSLTISADGFIWLIAFYNISSLAHPDNNWIDQGSAHLVQGISQVEEGHSDAGPGGSNDGLDHGDGHESSIKKPSRWSRLLSPLRPHRTYGATNGQEGNGSRRPLGGASTDEEVERRNQASPLPDVAIVHGVAAGGTQVYAQTGPMAPAWLVQDVAVHGKAGSEPIQDQS